MTIDLLALAAIMAALMLGSSDVSTPAHWFPGDPQLFWVFAFGNPLCSRNAIFPFGCAYISAILPESEADSAGADSDTNVKNKKYLLIFIAKIPIFVDAPNCIGPKAGV